MRLLTYWRHSGCGPHATVYLGGGLVAAPAKYGARVTVWDVREVAHPRLVADLPGRPDCQAAALCQGFLLVGSDRGIESFRFSPTAVTPMDCCTFAPAINDFEVAADTVLVVSKHNALMVVRVGADGRLSVVGRRDQVLGRCHGASHEGRLAAVIGFGGAGAAPQPLGLFPDAVGGDGRFTAPASWTLANGAEPARWFRQVSNRIILYRQRAYVATGQVPIPGGKKPWVLDPTVSVFCVADPARPQLLGHYPCPGATTCTGLFLDRERECLLAGSGNTVRRFAIEGDLLHEDDRLVFPYGDLGDGYEHKPPTIHDVCKTDLVHDGHPVFMAGGQQHDDLYLFTA